MSLNKPQPPPNEGSGHEVWPLVFNSTGLVMPDWLRADMRERHDMGVKKYGTGLRVWNGRDAVTDAFQEALDLIAYARQARERVGAPIPPGMMNAAMTLDLTIHFAVQTAIRLGELVHSGKVPTALVGVPYPSKGGR